ncbi:MAG: NAD-dependent DNA ligase LigA [bacterium]|nr:NAD-dependent DNA ligase LigA [bacterium]
MAEIREPKDRHEAEAAIRQLTDEIRYHDWHYYVLDSPVISDAEYDQLLARLRDLEQRFPDLRDPDSPTQRVSGQVRPELGTVRHPSPMLSLKSAYQEDEVRNFDKNCRQELGRQRVEYVAEPKYDGLAVELIYRNGRLEVASTRGDGQVGEDVTANVKTIREVVPVLITAPGEMIPSYLIVRGEVYMRKDEFQRLNRQRAEAGESLFANPRNAAAGSLRQLDSAITARRPLHIFFYEIIQVEGVSFTTHWEVLNILPRWGLKTDLAHVQLCSSLEEALLYHRQLEKIRDELEYDLDGVVFKVNQLSDRERLGFRTRDPRWALAYKFTPRQMTSRIRAIRVQVGRTGLLTPVAELDPVHIGGVEVKSASLHNQSEIERKDIRIGDRVLVERAGDVIPYVVKPIKEERNGSEQVFHFPETCPVCGAAVVMSEDKKAAMCTGMTCPAQIKKRIVHFASKRGMDIEGLGEKMAEQLVDQGLVRRLSSIYQLRRQDLLALERMGEKSTDNLLRAISASKSQPLDRFLYALGIPLVGEHLARVLAENFAGLDELMAASRDDLDRIREIGPAVANSIASFLANPDNRAVIEEMRQAGLSLPNPHFKRKAAGRLPLSGRTFVFTGKLERWTREQAKAVVESLGGRVTERVSADTDYLVAGPGAGSKLDEAKRRGIQIISEDELVRLIKER